MDDDLGREGLDPSTESGETTDAVNSISLIGEVDYPGTYIMSKPLTLRDAILFVGGLKFSSASYGYLHRRIKEGGTAQDTDLNGQTKLLDNPESSLPNTKIIKIDLEPMKRGNVPEPNIQMEAEDIFVVPQRNVEYFYVIGEVAHPGPYEANWRKPFLVSHAISYAGGPTKTAKISRGLLIRYVDGKREQIKVDFGAILRGKSEDFEIFPDDIIFIPGPIKTLPPHYDPPPNWREYLQLPPFC